jgi:hypothetical protein
MDFRNKLECLSMAKPFQPSLLIKAGAYLNEAPFRHFTLGKASGLTHKH